MNGCTNGHAKKSKKTKKGDNVSATAKFLQDHYHMMQVLKVSRGKTDRVEDSRGYVLVAFFFFQISCDWLRCNKDLMTPLSGWKAVFENFAILLNYLSPLVNNNEGTTIALSRSVLSSPSFIRACNYVRR